MKKICILDYGSGNVASVYNLIKFLKLKFQQAKGFDASAAALEFDTLLSGRIGKSTGAPILSASRSRGNYPYLTSYGSTPDTNFGA